MFLAKYDLTKGMPGAPIAVLDLAVDAPKRMIVGMVKITQATSPPIDVTDHLHGWFFERKNHEVIVFVAADLPLAPGRMEFQAVMVLPRWGAEGEGFFKYTLGSAMYEAGPVPAKPVEVPVTA